MSGAFGGVNVSTLGEQADSAYDSRKDEMAMEANHLALADARRNDEQKQALHNQQMFINDNYDAIANDVKAIDPEADDYDDRMASLPLGVRESPLLRSKMESLERGRKGVQVGRANAYNAQEKSRTDGLKRFETIKLPFLSPSSQQDYHELRRTRPDLTPEKVDELLGAEAERGIYGAAMQKDADETRVRIQSSNKDQDDNLKRIKTEHGEILTRLVDLRKLSPAAMIGLSGTLSSYADDESANGKEQKKKVDELIRRKNKLELLIKEGDLASSKRGSENIKAGKEAMLVSYNQNIKNGLGRRVVDFRAKARAAFNDPNMNEAQRSQFYQDNAAEARDLYDFANSQMKGAHSYIFDSQTSQINKARPVAIGDRLPSKAIELFIRDANRKSTMIGGKMYFNPFNPPNREQLNKETTREGLKLLVEAKGTESFSDFEKVIDSTMENVALESRAKMKQLIIAAVAGDDIDEEALAGLYKNDKEFIANIQKSKFYENDNPFEDTDDTHGILTTLANMIEK